MVYIYSYSLTILNILTVLSISNHFMIIVSLDPYWGLGSDLFILCCPFYCYYGLFLLNITVNSLYDYYRYSYSMIC